MTCSASGRVDTGSLAERRVTIEDTLGKLLRWLDRHGLASYDPVDILESAVIRRLTFGNQFAERVALQLGQRLPLNLRPLLGIKRHLSSQTLALVSSARAWQRVAGWPSVDDETVRRAAHSLIQDRLGHGDRYIWGLKLHFSTRFVQASPSTPNLFQTTNAIHALLDAYQATGAAEFADAASRAVDACATHLGFVSTTGGRYCRYYPGMDTPVYNVNALLSAACWRLSCLDIGRAELHAERATELLGYVLNGQRSSGAWPYASHPAGQWVDGFHTGYVLEALGHFLDSPMHNVVAGPLDTGVQHFAAALIDPDGCPRYTDRSRYPIDVQNCAQAIQTIARLVPRGGLSTALLERTVDCVVRELFLPDGEGGGYFAARRRFPLTNKTPYVRWGQAPMMLALTHAWNVQRGGRRYLERERLGAHPRVSAPGSAN
jgi:hypothetical protein